MNKFINGEIQCLISTTVIEVGIDHKMATIMAIENSDIVVFLVAHKEFKNLKIGSDKLILDFCGVFK